MSGKLRRSFTSPMLSAGLFLAIVTPLGPGALAEPKVFCDANPANYQTYKALHQTLFIERDTSRVGEFYHDQFISHNVDNGGSSARTLTAEGMVPFWERSKRVDPNRDLQDELIFCVADFVIVRTTMTGERKTSRGEQLPEPTSYGFTAIDMYRFRDGKVAERWGNADTVSFFGQLGFELEFTGEKADAVGTIGEED